MASERSLVPGELVNPGVDAVQLQGASSAIASFQSKCPEGWDVIPLTDAVFFQEGPGILAKDFRDEGVPLLRLKCIEGDYVRLDGCNFLDPKMVAKKWNHFRVDDGDLLISTSATLGRVSVVTSKSAGGIPYTGLIRFRPKDTRLDISYLKAFLSSAAFVSQAESMATGSVIRHFGPLHIRQMALFLPPINEQVEIGAINSILDERLRAIRETNATLEAITQALFKSWFVDFDPVRAKAEGREPDGMDATTAALFPDSFEDSPLGLIPKGWKATTLVDLCTSHGGLIQTGPFGSQLHASDYVTDGMPVVMPQDIQGRRVSLEKIARVPPADTARLSRHQLIPRDIVFSRRGDVGRHAVISSNESGWLCGTGCLLVRPGSDFPSPTFLSEHLARAETIAWLQRHAVGATMPNLNTGILSALPVLDPASSVMRSFEAVAGIVEAKISLNHAAARSLVQLRDTLLPRLISGKLRLPEAQTLIEEATP